MRGTKSMGSFTLSDFYRRAPVWLLSLAVLIFAVVIFIMVIFRLNIHLGSWGTVYITSDTGHLASIAITEQRMDRNGEARPDRPDAGPFVASDSGFIISDAAFPLCTISEVSSSQTQNTGGNQVNSCRLTRSANRDWVVNVEGTAHCGVTCFSMTLGEDKPD